MPRVNLPDGSVINFPEGTPEAEMNAAIEGLLSGSPAAPVEQAQPTSYADKKAAFIAENNARMAGVTPESVSNDMQRIAGGVVRGMRDVPDAGAQLVTRGMEAGANYIAPDSGFSQWATGQRQNVEGINREAEREYQEEWRGGDTGFDAPRLAGNVLATAPLAYAMPGATAAGLGARVASGVAFGGLAASLMPVNSPEGQSASDFWQQKGLQAGTGALVGGAVPMVTSLAGRLINPKSSPEVQSLMKRGVTPTPGQTLGGGAKAFEEKMTSVPLVGDVIKGGQRRAIEDFNRAVYDDVLKPAGLPAPKTVGREAVEEVGNKLSQAYDDLVNNPAVTMRGDRQFAQELSNLNQMAQSLPAKEQAQWQKFITDKLVRAFSPNGRMDGRSFKELESVLSAQAKKFGGTTDAYQQSLGDAFGELLDSLRGAFARSNQGVMVNGVDAGKRLADLNASWAKLVRLERAAGLQGATDGVITPAQLSSAVKAVDQSTRGRAYARGTALMQDVSDPAKAVLGNTYPDSGTAGRALAAALTAGAVPISPALAGGMAAPMMAYTPMGQKLTAALLAGRQGPGYQAAAQGVRRLAPALTAGLPAAMAGQR